MKRFAAAMTGDLDLARRWPQAVVVCDSTGVTAEFTQRCFAATMAGTDLSHCDVLLLKFVSEKRCITIKINNLHTITTF